MLPPTIPESDTIKTCRAIPIWSVPGSRSGNAPIAPGEKTQPVAPRAAVIELIPAADFNQRRTGRPEGQPFSFLIEAVEVPVERVTLSAFVPKEHISTVAPLAKPGTICGPRANGVAALRMALQAGRMNRNGRPPGGELSLPPPYACEPHTETEAWHAAALRPSHPLPIKPVSIPFSPQAGGAAGVGRPKQALRELVLLSPRPWQSLAILWESFRGFHIALPSSEAHKETHLEASASLALWSLPADGCLAGNRFLRESEEIPFERQPSSDGAHARLLAVTPVAALVAFSPGLKQPFQCSRLTVGSEPFARTFAETLPLPMLVATPLPAVTLWDGLAIWNGTINSYTRRQGSLPRMREGGRVVHTLRLAPTMQLNEPCEITAA
jgi:hypothetical protein